MSLNNALKPTGTSPDWGWLGYDIIQDAGGITSPAHKEKGRDMSIKETLEALITETGKQTLTLREELTQLEIEDSEARIAIRTAQTTANRVLWAIFQITKDQELIEEFYTLTKDHWKMIWSHEPYEGPKTSIKAPEDLIQYAQECITAFNDLIKAENVTGEQQRVISIEYQRQKQTLIALISLLCDIDHYKSAIIALERAGYDTKEAEKITAGN